MGIQWGYISYDTFPPCSPPSEVKKKKKRTSIVKDSFTFGSFSFDVSALECQYPTSPIQVA